MVDLQRHEGLNAFAIAISNMHAPIVFSFIPIHAIPALRFGAKAFRVELLLSAKSMSAMSSIIECLTCCETSFITCLFAFIAIRLEAMASRFGSHRFKVGGHCYSVSIEEILFLPRDCCKRLASAESCKGWETLKV